MKKFLDKVLKYPSSIKTAIILSLLIILASAVGTFIPQGLVYRAPWFIMLLLLLGLNIFFCTLKQIRFQAKTSPTVITHLGLLLILIGALITGIFGERGFMLIFKNHNQDTFIDADNKFKTLDFKIYLDNFFIDFYDDANNLGRSIKSFKSKVTIFERDREILKKTIEVNHPLTYKGYSFYQASYDQNDFKWTGLDVVKDPGVPFVWLGIILLNLGVFLRFYLKPKMA